MKKITLWSLLAMVLLVACSDDEGSDPIFSKAGTINETDINEFGFVVDLDNGMKLSPVTLYYKGDVENEERVIATYTVIAKTDIDSANVNMIDIEKIITKDILELTEQNQDSIGNDFIYTNKQSIWMSEKHLNILFEFYGQDSVHLVNLVRPIGKPVDGENRIILELKHNDKNDRQTYIYQGIMSFNLESLKEADEESVTFVLQTNDYRNRPIEWEGTYTFEANELPPTNKILNLKNLNNAKIK